MKKIQKTVLAALFAALIFCATFVVKIPSPTQGYVHLGDCFVLVGAWLLGPIYGALAAGIGSLLSDLLGGYAAYILPTFVIKSIMALLACLIYFAMRRVPRTGRVVSGIVAELFMVVGYYLVEATFFGYGFIGAAAGIPGNIGQGVFGIVSATLVMELLFKSKLIARFFPEE